MAQLTNTFAEIDAELSQAIAGGNSATKDELAAHEKENGSGASATLASNREHWANAIEIVDAGAYTSEDNVEDALQDLYSQVGALSATLMTDHIQEYGDGTKSAPATNREHWAAAIEIVDTAGNFSSTEVEGALAEVFSEKANFLTSTHKTADGSGGSSTPATNKEHNAAAIALTDSGGHYTTDDVESALSEIGVNMGTLDFSATNYLTSMQNVTAALSALDNKVFEFFIKGNDILAEANIRRTVLMFNYDGNLSGTSGFFNMAYGIACSATHGIVMVRAGSVTGISVSWTGASITSDRIIYLKVQKNGIDLLSLSIDDTKASDLKDSSVLATGNYTFAAGDKLALAYAIDGSGDYLTDAVVMVEITLSTTTETAQ